MTQLDAPSIINDNFSNGSRAIADKTLIAYVSSCALLLSDSVSYALSLLSGIGLSSVWTQPYGDFDVPAAPIAFSGYILLFAVLCAYLFARGRYVERSPFWSESRNVIAAALWACATLGAAAVIFGVQSQAATALLTVLLFPLIATLFARVTRQLLMLADLWVLDVVIVGDVRAASDLVRALDSDKSLGLRVVARVDPTGLVEGGACGRLRAILDMNQAARLLIAIDGDCEMQRAVVQAALRERVPFAVTPTPHALPGFSHTTQGFMSHDAMMLSFRDGLSAVVPRTAKAVFDVTTALILLILTAPLLLLIAAIVRLDGGPAFFAHRRVGAGGRTFPCLKFRTMVTNSAAVLADILANDELRAAEWAANQKLSDDPRVTRIGKFLRATSLDELPQLFNVLRLDMSLVGPRPIVESEVAFYGPNIAQYYAIRPGVTGLWQVSGRSNTSYAQRVHLDVWYVNNWTFWTDIAVLLKTIPAVMSRSGAR